LVCHRRAGKAVATDNPDLAALSGVMVFDSLIAAVFVATSESAASSRQHYPPNSSDRNNQRIKPEIAAPFSIFATQSRNFKKDASVLTLERYARLMRS
jgi:hypothetical protein